MHETALEKPGTKKSEVNKDSQELVASAKRAGFIGEQAAEKIVRKYREPLLSLAYSILRDRDQAEDAVQISFSRFFKNLDRIDPEKIGVYNFLYRSVLRQARKIASSKYEKTPLLDEKKYVQSGFGRVNPDHMLDKRELRAKIEEYIDGMPETTKNEKINKHILKARLLTDKLNREIAQEIFELGLTERVFVKDAIDKRYHRSLKEMLEWFDGDLEDFRNI